MDTGERPSVSRLYGRGKRVKQCKRGILGPNWCAIVHDFWGGPGVWGHRGLKISSDMLGRLGSNPELPVYLVGASWFVKQEKRRKRGILRPNRCVITHDFRGGPRVWGCRGPKIKPVLPGRLGSIPLLPVCMGGAIWLVKRVKRREPRILRPNQCAIAHGFGGGLGVQGCHGRKINLDVSGRLGSISVLPICVGEAIWLVKRLKRCKWGILGPNRCAIAHGSKGGPGVENRPERAREAEECPSIACLYGRGHLVGQTGEMAKTGIFYSNRCAIAHGSGSELGVRECRGLKINSGIPGMLESILVFPASVGGAISFVKRAKRDILLVKRSKWCEWVILRPNRFAIAPSSGGGLGVQGCHGPKIYPSVPRRLGSIPVFPVFVGGAIWLVKRVKWHECGILGPNRCAISHVSGGMPGAENQLGRAREAGDRPSISRLYGRGHLVGQTGETAQTEHFEAKSVCYSPRFRRCLGLKIYPGMPGRLGSIPGNKLVGFIHMSLSNASRLEALEISYNSLQGNIPEWIGNLHNMKVLSIQANQLTGIIPQEIGNLVNLAELAMEINQITGFVPISILNISSLLILSLSMNNFSGFLPREIGNLTKMQNLQLGDNKLIGEIPKEISNLVELGVVDLSGNSFSG
ncbi:putative LRR receptor-like serine/threonine-protein kinase-like [Capsicum annuum]|nr:putative LRR receptor-like serine/threonine-protein kinase-like [Capsicum annuum]